jgi:hypothetical protein
MPLAWIVGLSISADELSDHQLFRSRLRRRLHRVVFALRLGAATGSDVIDGTVLLVVLFPGKGSTPMRLNFAKGQPYDGCFHKELERFYKEGENFLAFKTLRRVDYAGVVTLGRRIGSCYQETANSERCHYI